MERIKYFFLGILALSMVGCGQTVVETLHVPENPGHNAPGVGKTLVILPFADYSDGGSIASAQRRNMMVTESLTDRFLANGFSLPVQEDVFQYLVAEDIIQLYDARKSSSISAALADSDWSDVMKGELQRYQAEQNMSKSDSPMDSPGTHGLTPQAITKIGHDFNADYVVRGRILEFKTREDTSWEPWKKGILPFINNGSSRLLFGFADSENYDVFNNMATGALIGSIIGNNANSPTSHNGDNAAIWGAGGLVVGNINYHSGKVEQAAVQMRIWIQETSTGKVVWTNRVMVKVSPESVLADNQYDVLFNRAIEQGVTKLVDNFVIYTFM
ncbi:hypothetical protein [Desulfopila aestuarii]|uniref:Uncharacterized protein n=1 Tax=Desulfopila aestuarii DSM 18488 TaxID=1121416 RepID=A0A1M7YH89_9BACT|nr:hypothetical protein [Desulfopila aestuarii]SHO51963.1 hypothetical protein SAMN02745220_04308 [Desulfopila aestuarii DSM 18488]